MALNIENIQDYCRLCQENLGTINVIDNIEFTKQVSECSSVKINDECTQHFPKSVCTACHLNVEQMSCFIKKIELIDKKLHEYYLYLGKSQSSTSETVNDNIENGEKQSDGKKHFKIKDSKSSKKTENPACDEIKSINKNEELMKHDTMSAITPTSTLANSIDYRKDNLQNPVSDEDVSSSDRLDNDIHEKELKKLTRKYLLPCTYDNCSKVCTSAYSFRTHLMKHEGKTPFLCVTCGKGFRTKNSLNCHEKIHAKVKPYVCTECNIGFSISSNLRAHQRKHHEGVRFYCSQCPLVYISKDTLERHELVHTGIKEYKCGMCKSAFYTNKELMKHQRYHQGLRLYKCEQCFKTFFEKHHLTIHLRVHTGERPYVCKITGCGKSFTESQKLTRHLKARHTSS